MHPILVKIMDSCPTYKEDLVEPFIAAEDPFSFVDESGRNIYEMMLEIDWMNLDMEQLGEILKEPTFDRKFKKDNRDALWTLLRRSAPVPKDILIGFIKGGCDVNENKDEFDNIFTKYFSQDAEGDKDVVRALLEAGIDHKSTLLGNHPFHKYWFQFEKEITQVCEERKEQAIHPLLRYLIDKEVQKDSYTLKSMIRMCKNYFAAEDPLTHKNYEYTGLFQNLIAENESELDSEYIAEFLKQPAFDVNSTDEKGDH